MPRAPRQDLQPVVHERPQPIVRSSELIPGIKKEAPRGNTEAYIQTTDIELKFKILAESVARDFLPLDFTANDNISETTVNKLAENAYIFVDNNGKPVKILAPSVLRTEIKWEDLAETTKQKIQTIIDNARLLPGRHITIENNRINADIGVETINGQTGDVSLSAEDINVYTKDVTYNKTEVQDLLDNLTIIVDGGRIE